MKSSSHPGMELVTVHVFFSCVINNTTKEIFKSTGTSSSS